MRCVGQVEIEPFCQKVLAKHWPNVWRWNDVKTLTGELVKAYCGTVDLLCGGVPCQPASVAGKRKGADDHRWLWPDFLRVVSEVNPVWVLAENPRGVLSLDVGGVQFSEWIANEFAARGYELLPFKLAAEDVGAPHRRERVFFVAYRDGNGWARDKRGASARKDDSLRWSECAANAGFSGDDFARRKLSQMEAGVMDDAAREQDWRLQFGELATNSGTASQQVADADSGTGAASGQGKNKGRSASALSGNGYVADANETRLQEHRQSGINGAAQSGQGATVARSGYQWPSRPGQPQYEWEQPRTIELPLGGAVAGLPVRLVRRHRVSALKALGNAIVPQVAEVIGRAIMQMVENRQ